jgi:hypothetical protein
VVQTWENDANVHGFFSITICLGGVGRCVAGEYAARHIRLLINLSHGLPAVREIEFYEELDAEIAFPDWIIGVSSLENPDSAAITRNTFIRLARLCDGWETVPAQWPLASASSTGTTAGRS